MQLRTHGVRRAHDRKNLHGVTTASKSDDYLTYLNRTGIPDYLATEGNRGVYVLRRVEGNQAHVLLLSLWESREAIEKFAGTDIEKACYYPEDEQFLLELEPGVTPYKELTAKGAKKKKI